ncbi:1982_t:CDS:1 [Entrophospora sp. SA101]|nr:9671_t:CDS:1 [Entrophospora sp. SA101]CAJ0641655.1 1982_t:CDS:1 [Entrophospora sp. SA101]CAJ0828692.1 15023_t:CDS:1 [Entrophospora sp. SA101]CAJ0909275.1 14557_t:CDS:1 [Entrophospora sp. SA101]
MESISSQPIINTVNQTILKPNPQSFEIVQKISPDSTQQVISTKTQIKDLTKDCKQVSTDEFIVDKIDEKDNEVENKYKDKNEQNIIYKSILEGELPRSPTLVEEETNQYLIDNPSFNSSNISINTNINCDNINEMDIRNYLQYIAAMIIGKPLKDLDDHEESLFNIGMNELQCNLFLRKINNILPTFTKINNLNFIQEHNSIDLITKVINGALNNRKSLKNTIEGDRDDRKKNDANDLNQQQHDLEGLVDKYTLYIKENYQQSIETTRPNLKSSTIKKRIYLLTGATSFLGVHILYDLLTNNATNDSEIYCLIKRKKKAHSPKASLKHAFLLNGLDISLIDSKNNLIVLPANLSESYLGLSIQQYESLSKKVTTVIHSTSLITSLRSISISTGDTTLPSYENCHVLPTSNLLLFSAKKEFFYISNIDSCINGPWEIIPEGIFPIKSSITTQDGYGLSKLAIESIIINTFDYLQLEKLNIIRLSTLTSSTVTGAWNPDDFVPLLLSNVGRTGRMPVFELDIDWVPVNIASKSIVELITMMHHNTFRVEINHLRNPDTLMTWKDYLDVLEEYVEMKFERQELNDWLKQLVVDLENVNLEHYENKSDLMLFEHFKRIKQFQHGDDNAIDSNNNPTKSNNSHDLNKRIQPKLDITNTKSKSLGLQKCPPISEDLIKLNINWLRNTSYLDETYYQQINKSLRKNNKKMNLTNNEAETGLLGWICVTAPLMVFFFIIDVLWSILSKNFWEIGFILGWFITVIFVDDKNINNREKSQNNEENPKRIIVNRKKRLIRRRVVNNGN